MSNLFFALSTSPRLKTKALFLFDHGSNEENISTGFEDQTTCKSGRIPSLGKRLFRVPKQRAKSCSPRISLACFETLFHGGTNAVTLTQRHASIIIRPMSSLDSISFALLTLNSGTPLSISWAYPC